MQVPTAGVKIFQNANPPAHSQLREVKGPEVDERECAHLYSCFYEIVAELT